MCHSLVAYIKSSFGEKRRNCFNGVMMETTEKNQPIIEALKTVFDPEIPVNIFELGMIYEINQDEENKVVIKMTLTSHNCPAVGSLPTEVEDKVKSLPGITDCKVELVWEPPWGPDKMSAAARLQLNMF